MESNKLLIGVQFIDDRGASIVIELIVLRDITLKQLLDGIRYGLLKKSGSSDIYQICSSIYEDCLKAVGPDGSFRRLTLTSYNNALIVRKDSRGRAVFGKDDLDRKLFEIGFITSTRIVFDSTEQYETYEVNTADIIPAFNPDNPDTSIVFPQYNISTRQLYQFDDTPVEIIPPADPPQKREQNLFFTMLPALTMISTMILVRSLMMMSSGNGGLSMVLLSGAMGIATLVTSTVNYFRQKSAYKKQLRDWREHYQEYIRRLIIGIENRKDLDVKKLCELYPDVNDILDNSNMNTSVYSVSSLIFSRAAADRDFLGVRLGVSDDVRNMFEISGKGKDEVFSAANFAFENGCIRLSIPEDKDYQYSEDPTFYLSNLPAFIAKEYACMKQAPLLFPLKDSGALGVVSQDPEITDLLLERMIFDLCFYHSPDELQFVALFPRTDDPNEIERRISAYKFLPHFRELFADRSQFVFSQDSANSIFSIMLNIMGERTEEDAAPGTELPHIVFLVYDEYDLKEHAFSQYLPQVPPDGEPFENKLGLSFVFPKIYREHLPAYCDHVITVRDHFAELVPRENENLRQRFTFSPAGDWARHLYNSYKILSALSYAKISANGKVPSAVSLFELYGLSKDHIDIGEFWEGRDGKRRYDVQSSIGVPIGRTDSGLTVLDLHERADGPHMLVAGTTGSGKSETIISYLLGLCLCFRPDEVNLMLVDMKGGGFIKRIGTLPHVVGSVTDVDGDENGTGAEYMLKRFLNALTSEIRRRKILFNSMYVDSINGYIKACRDIESHIKNINNRLRGENKDQLSEKEMQALRDQAKNDSLAHLILVVDEFTELKRFSTENNDVDFIGEITTIARVGRSLGFHIILISQNIEGAITDDIRVNSKSRLCLKVATRQASKEMIGNDLAASPTMPGNGRGYLLVGTGSKFEYFQSAYSGATVEDNMETPIEIVKASKTGAYTVFYQSERDNREYIERKKELEKLGQLETQLNAVVGAIKTYYDQHAGGHPAPHIVFQKPLPQKMYLKDGVIYEYQDGKYEPVREV